MKRCTVCKIDKNVDSYSVDSYRKDGFDATCKGCKRKQRIEKKEKEKERRNSTVPQSKRCSNCEQTVSSDNFHKKPGSADGLHTECKDCKKEKRLTKKKENQSTTLPGDYKKTCTKCGVQKNKDDFYTQIYSTDGIGTICINCDKLSHGQWRKLNPKKIAEYRSKAYFKCAQNREFNPQGKLSSNLRNRVRQAIKRDKSEKYNNTFELIDCSPKEMIKWIEYQFDTSMTWENYGTYWQVDHVIPCDYFDLKIREEQLRCFNWRNCRPLEKIKNIKKNNKIEPLQIHLQEIHVHYYERHIQIAGKF